MGFCVSAPGVARGWVAANDADLRDGLRWLNT